MGSKFGDCCTLHCELTKVPELLEMAGIGVSAGAAPLWLQGLLGDASDLVTKCVTPRGL